MHSLTKCLSENNLNLLKLLRCQWRAIPKVSPLVAHQEIELMNLMGNVA
jgi:hypothetical protein